MTSVLVVDDAPATRAILSEVLTLEGYSVQTAEHGGPALEIMRASHEHLLITLGLMMPVVDGWAVLEAVAADGALAQRHAIIMVTGSVGAAAKGPVAALREQLGVPLVAKPFTVAQLLDALEEAERGWTLRFGDARDR